jgi:cytochrome c-type biogenesis protein CcsB
MAVLESVFLFTSLACVVLSLTIAIVAFARSRKQSKGSKSGARNTASEIPGAAAKSVSGAFLIAALAALTLTIAFRAVESGRGPFSNMYEFAIAFAWGVLLAGLLFRIRYKTAAVQNIGLIIAFLLLVFAVVQYTRPAPLVPALQQSALLSVHVMCAVVAYGTLSIGFGAAILVLVKNRSQSDWLPESEVLDNISYRSVIIGFPFLTLLIILGALWADIAWGRYWGWDPKESASLVTWLIYAGYIHARAMRGWRQNKAAILLIAGFAAIMMTFFGNYIFAGLHAYQ